MTARRSPGPTPARTWPTASRMVCSLPGAMDSSSTSNTRPRRAGPPATLDANGGGKGVAARVATVPSTLPSGTKSSDLISRGVLSIFSETSAAFRSVISCPSGFSALKEIVAVPGTLCASPCGPAIPEATTRAASRAVHARRRRVERLLMALSKANPWDVRRGAATRPRACRPSRHTPRIATGCSRWCTCTHRRSRPWR